MKFAVLALALLGYVAADVSHLNNMYLPPVIGQLSTKQHISYAQESQEIPQVSVKEVNDNHVAEDEQSQLASAEVGPVISQHVQTANTIGHHVQAHAREPVAGVSAVDASSVYNQKQYQQEPERFYSAGSAHLKAQESVAVIVEQQHQNQGEQIAQYAVEEHHHVESYQPEQQQQKHSGAEEHHHLEIYQPQQEQHSTIHHVENQKASSSSSGIDTEYGANGGYVY